MVETLKSFSYKKKTLLKKHSFLYRSMTSRLLDDQSTVVTTNSNPKSEDEGYFATYNHYDIHKEMLQV